MYQCDSREIAVRFNKRHNHVLRDIERLIERENLIYDFIKSSYKASRGNTHPCFLITKHGVERLHNQYKYRAKSASLEKKFAQVLLGTFKDILHIETQFKVSKYRLDFYIPKLNLAIEYDEKEHEVTSKQRDDKIRENNVMREMPGIKFIRVKEGDEIKGLNQLQRLLFKTTYQLN